MLCNQIIVYNVDVQPAARRHICKLYILKILTRLSNFICAVLESAHNKACGPLCVLKL